MKIAASMCEGELTKALLMNLSALVESVGITDEEYEQLIYQVWLSHVEYVTVEPDMKQFIHVLDSQIATMNIFHSEKYLDFLAEARKINAFWKIKTNDLGYLPSEHLSWDSNIPGWNTLGFRKDRVLTMEGKKRGTWKSLPFLLPEHVYGKKKNSSRNGGLYYCGIWQELVVNESKGLAEWAMEVISNQ